MSKISSLESSILSRHREFLLKHGSFPEKSRKSIYMELMKLPNNYGHLQELTKHYMVLPEHRGNKQIAIVVDILGRLYPDLKNEWISSMVHPFTKLFIEDFTFAFESSLTFLLNWQKPLLYDFPNLNRKLTEILEIHFITLKNKVEMLDYPLSSLFLPIFVVSLTDILNKKDWLQACDYWLINSEKPWLFITTAMAIVEVVQKQIENLFSVEEMSIVLRKEKKIEIKAILQRAQELTQKYESKFIDLYKDSVFPIQKGRYPVHKFFSNPIRFENQKLSEMDSLEQSELQNKFRKLESMLQRVINEGHQKDSRALEEKYQLVEGQIHEYLKKIKEEHHNKLSAIREIESAFSAQLHSQGKERKDKVSTIEKQARLQREIDLLMRESEEIKKIEQAMVGRISQAVKIRKNELRKEIG